MTGQARNDAHLNAGCVIDELCFSRSLRSGSPLARVISAGFLGRQPRFIAPEGGDAWHLRPIRW
eukprot:9277000-Alexandrium_andersonii.AAC.1